MKIEIEKEFENPLLDRKELEAIVRHPRETTPTRSEIREKLAARLNCDKDTVFIHQLNTEFGIATTKIYARVYTSASDAEKIEPKYIIKRNKPEKEETA